MTSLLRLYVGISLALIAFAANSVLNRLALADDLIDPGSFTLWRLSSGAVTLLFLCWLKSLANSQEDTFIQLKKGMTEGNWLSALALFAYAVSFSYAYVSLSTGMGALVLFAMVQLTLITLSIYSGQTLSRLEWLGLALAFAGFVYLLLPNVTSPSFMGFVLMSLSGVAWGLYTWRGKLSKQALWTTTANFTRTLPILLVVFLCLLWFGDSHVSRQGIALAVLSGAVMSGLGYALWYAVLPLISASMAAVLQLLVPIIATFGGIIFSGENMSFHLMSATLVVILGVLLVILGRK
ncbi:DMT family transporter [Marinomonas sp. THO17]|uniref:DMT family transporter n=1 Tax=Marinomonas sp. THO17 TaxID=3149048 RepID=UPI00336BF7C0